MKKNPTFFDITSLQKRVCIKSVGFFFRRLAFPNSVKINIHGLRICVKCNFLSMNFPQTYNERGR